MLTIWLGPPPPLSWQNWKPTFDSLQSCSTAVRSPEQKHHNGTQNRQVAASDKYLTGQEGPPTAAGGPELTPLCLSGRQLGRPMVSSSRTTTGAVAGSQGEQGRTSGVPASIIFSQKN